MGGQRSLILFHLRNEHHLGDVRQLTIESPKWNDINLSSTVVLNLDYMIESSARFKEVLIPRPLGRIWEVLSKAITFIKKKRVKAYMSP